MKTIKKGITMMVVMLMVVCTGMIMASCKTASAASTPPSTEINVVDVQRVGDGAIAAGSSGTFQVTVTLRNNSEPLSAVNFTMQYDPTTFTVPDNDAQAATRPAATAANSWRSLNDEEMGLEGATQQIPGVNRGLGRITTFARVAIAQAHLQAWPVNTPLLLYTATFHYSNIAPGNYDFEILPTGPGGVNFDIATFNPSAGNSRPIVPDPTMSNYRLVVAPASTESAVNFSVVNGNGTLTARIQGEGSDISNGAVIPNGSTVNFTAAPAENFKVKEWKVGGIVVDGNTTNTLSMPINANTNVTVEYETITHAVTYSVVGTPPNGTLGGTVVSGGTANQGSSVTFTATPAEGYQVREWKYNGDVVNGTALTYVLPITEITNVTVEFEQTTYAVTFSVVGGTGGTLAAAIQGGATVLNNGQVAHGSILVFTSNAEAGYRIKEWRVGGGLVNGTNATYTTTALAAPINVTIEYELDAFPVTFSVFNGNGTISAMVEGGSAFSSTTLVATGSNIIFAATPNADYRVKEWRVGGTVQTGETANTFTLENLAGAQTVVVEFELIPTYAVTFGVVSGNGTVTAAVGGSPISSGVQVREESTVVFTAVAEDGYRVKEWKVDGIIQTGEKSLTFTYDDLDGTINVTVEFEEIPSTTYTVTYDVYGDNNGTVAASVQSGSAIGSGSSVAEGSAIVFTATPANGYRVKAWRVGGIVQDGETANTFNYFDLMGVITVSVEFEVATYTVTFSVENNNGSVEAEVDGGSEITSGVTAVVHDSTVVFTATPDNGYRVKAWRVGGVIQNGQTSNTFTFENLDGDITVTVEFEEIPPQTYTVTFSVENNNGNVTAIVEGGSAITSAVTQVNEGSNIVFTATPNAGYRVKAWRVGGVIQGGETGNTFTYNGLLGDLIVTVEFELIPLPTHTVTFNVVGGNGTIGATVQGSTITSGATPVNVGSTIVFTATPAEGYRVKAWKVNGEVQDGETANIFTLINFAGGVTVTVEYELVTYTVVFNTPDTEYGSIEVKIGEDEIASGLAHAENSVVTIIITFDEGYEIKTFKINGVDMKDALVEVDGTFQLVHTLTGNLEIIIEIDEESTSGSQGNPNNINIILWILLGIAAFGGLVAILVILWARRKRKSLRKV